MSHPVNDMIADQAIDTVADWTLRQVLNYLRENKIVLANGEDPVDVAIEVYHTELCERPGPYG